jgi:hypothetical protein
MNHISTEDMFRLADGDLAADQKQAFIRHISDCEQCKAKLRQTLSFNDNLSEAWNENLSQTCLDDDTLFRYMEGKLSASELADFQSHLKECPVCGQKAELADQAFEHIDNFEHARMVKLPSILNRLKTALNDIEWKRFLTDLEKLFVSSNLGNELFSIISRGSDTVKYTLANPLEVQALAPVTAGAVKFADTGKGFQKRIISEEGIPFEVEIVQFGERLNLNIKSLDESYSNVLLKYILLEESLVRRQGILQVSGGKTSVSFNEADIQGMRPEKIPLSIQLEILLKEFDIKDLSSNDIAALLKSLGNQLQSDDPVELEAAVDAINSINRILPESS